MRYLVITESAETKTTDVINEIMNEGFQNGYFKTLATVDTIEEARAILAKYTIKPEKVRFGSVVRYESWLAYIEEQEYDEDYEEWNPTGSYEFADVVEEDEDDLED